MTYPRVHLDPAAYERRSRTAACFICDLIAGTHDGGEEVVYRDERAIVFLDRYPTLVGKLLVAPIAHREGVVGDFDEDEYLALQRVVHRAARAVSRTVPTERIYLLSLGSNQGNAHVHWHIAPLPPGVPYERQQFAALMWDEDGYLDIPAADRQDLAARIAGEMQGK